MSCYEWERGEFTLPSAAAPKFRATMAKAAADYKLKLYEHAQTFWKALPAAYKRDDKKYQAAVRRYAYGNLPSNDQYEPYDPKLPAWRGVAGRDENDVGFAADLNSLLGWRILHHTETVEKSVTQHDGSVYTWTNKEWRDNPPRRVRKPDVDAEIGKSTGAKFTLSLGEASLTFDGRKVVWDVPENNHARDRGRDHPLARTFFQLLDRVAWTRGTGGTIVGNDEYNRDSHTEGGGSNYSLGRWGPNYGTRRPSRDFRRY